MIVLASAAIVAWGALAFGAVYPWAYTPLLIVCGLTGAFGLYQHRTAPVSRAERRVLLALVLVLAAAVVQIIPLPNGLLRAVSPGTDTFLLRFDFTYAFGSGTPGGDGVSPAWHPLSISPRASWTGVALLGGFLLYLAGLTRALSRSGVRAMAASLVVFGSGLALFGILQRATLGDHAWGGMKMYGLWTPENLLTTPFGPYVNKNHFAGWMLMGLPLGIGLAIGAIEQGLTRIRGEWRSVVLWFSSPEGGRAQFAVLAVLTMGASLLMTRSRSGLVCLGFMILLMTIAARRRFRSARAGWAAFASLAALFLLVFAFAGADLTARIANRMDVTELRRNIWSDSTRIIRDFPLTGTGLNTFGTAMITYQTTQQDQHFQEAHNDYLQILVEGGLLLAVPVLIALVLIVRAIRARFAARQDDPMTYWIRVGATIGLLAIALQSFVEFSLQMPGNAAMFVVLLAIALHEGRALPSEGRSHSSGRSEGRSHTSGPPEGGSHTKLRSVEGARG